MNLRIASLLIVAAVLFPSPAFAQQELRPLPPLLRSVSDEVGALSAEQGEKLSVALYDILRKAGVRMVLVFAETTRPELLEDYAERLAQRWARDRAIDPTRTIFVIVAINDREMRVMPGRALGLSEALYQSGSTVDLDEHFRDGRFFDGLMLLTARIRKLIESRPTTG